MSQVFMCDNCGEMFSVNQSGWRQFTEHGDGPEYNNAWNHGALTRHIGPCCNLTAMQPKPRIALMPTQKDD